MYYIVDLVLINEEGVPFGKVFARGFRIDRVTSEGVLCKTTEGKYFPV